MACRFPTDVICAQAVRVGLSRNRSPDAGDQLNAIAHNIFRGSSTIWPIELRISERIQCQSAVGLP
jgi:hypothetical protein